MGDFIIENGVLTSYLGTDKDICIPEGVRVIGPDVFRRKGVVSVTMPDTVVEIGWDAFSSCRSLKNVRFSRNLRQILLNAFANCPNLTRVELFDGLESIGSCAFSGCSRMEELILPEHPIKIGEHTFSGCCALADENGFVIIRGILYDYNARYPEQFHVPDGVRCILSSVAWRLSNVRSVALPESIQHMEDGCFHGISNLDKCTIWFPVTDPKEAQRLVKRVFPWGVLARTYLYGAFSACELVMETLKKQIASKAGRVALLGELIDHEDPTHLNRFLGCVKKLPLAELDDAIEKAKHTAIRAALLEYKQTVYTPKKVEKARQDAEDKELGLKEKTLSDWRRELKIVKKGGCYVVTGFKDDAAKKAVLSGDTPEGTEVLIPGQIGGIPVEIADQVFRNCPYVKSVIILEGVTAIGDYAFSNCKRLKDVYVPASAVRLGANNAAFYMAGQLPWATIHAPAGSKAEEQAKKYGLPFVAE